jgi:hypothetical protein
MDHREAADKTAEGVAVVAGLIAAAMPARDQSIIGDSTTIARLVVEASKARQR